MGVNINPQQLALLLLQKNPRIAQNPMGQQLVQALRTGDTATGEKIARNICQSMGITPEQATQQAQQFFGGMKF